MRRAGSPAGGPFRAPVRPVAIAAAALLAAACSRDDVSHARVPKVAATAMPGGVGPVVMPPAGVPGAAGGGIDAPPAPQGASALAWTLPKGWTETGASAMRYATLKAPVEGRLDVSVVVLPGPAGGELANVNRWRNQIGLPPLDEAALGASRKTLKTKAGPVSVFDFTSEGQAKSRMIAGLLSVGGSTWFVKMVGDAGPVGTARPDFTRLLESLRLGQAD
jgi:hypothetical protein